MARPGSRSRDERTRTGRVQQREPDGARSERRGRNRRSDGQPPIEGTTLTAIFSEDARVAGSAGCNRYFGRADAETGRMRVGPLGSTLMACEANGVMTQEQRFLELPQSASSYSVIGDQLRLGPSRGTVTLVFTAQ